jgi:hypothetical protein
MKIVRSQRWRKENVAQQHRHTYAHRAPVVEPLGAEAIEEVHPHHDNTGDVEHVEDNLLTGLIHAIEIYSIKHDTYREHSRHGSQDNIKYICLLFESGFH